MVLSRSRLPLPPEHLMMAVGCHADRTGRTDIEGEISEDFILKGKEFLQYFIGIMGLKPYERVLDVGCGVGRMARPLTGHLDSRGSYFGFDVSKESIAWCSDNIERQYPNFQFSWLDVSNGLYNPAGGLDPQEATFPQRDAVHDFAFATSLFTHMTPLAVARYLTEISRVLVRGGRLLSTWFLLNHDARDLLRRDKSFVAFNDVGQFVACANNRRAETAIAYDEHLTLRLHEEAGLLPHGQVLYGKWCGRSLGLSYQDMIVAVKE